MITKRFAHRSGLISLIALFASACANGPCHHLREPQLAENQAAAQAAAASRASVTAKPTATSTTAPGSSMSLGASSETVYVYKADGSLQCGQAKGLSLEDMRKQLNGLPVLSSDKRPDGKMHIQVCGAPTGLINVFEIPEANLKDAESRGFKKL